MSMDTITGKEIASHLAGSNPTGEIVAPIATFRDLFIGALVAVGTDSSFPTLESVKVTFNAGKLRVEATDRYRLVTGETDATGETFEALIHRKDLEKVIRICKDFKSIALEATLKRVGFDQVTFTALDQSVTFRVMDGTFPSTSHLFTDTPAPALSVMAFNPKFLGDFAKIPCNGTRQQVPMVMTFNGAKGAQITIAHDSIAWKCLLMPMRYAV